MKNNRIIKSIVGVVTALVLVLTFAVTASVKAEDEGFAFAVTPMDEKILLNPGDHYSSSMTVYNPATYTEDVEYKIEVADYYVDENYKNIFDECGSHCEMTKWITINSPTEGRLAPGEKAIINYSIDVPANAAGGGQYASIMVQGGLWSDEEENEEDAEKGDISSNVKEERKIAYIIYAEIAGEIDRKGEIEEASVPSFLLSGNIKGISAIRNTGNVHGQAIYKLQVFPLFSNEEIYTNEEDPKTALILPDRTRYEELAWENTPAVGIFNVLYTVEFEGVTTEVSKMVIKCPVWLLFLIIFVIVTLIIWIVVRVKNRRNAKNQSKSQVAR